MDLFRISTQPVCSHFSWGRTCWREESEFSLARNRSEYPEQQRQ